MLAEVVVAIDGLAAEVAHESATAARHSVAALRLDETRSTLMALPDTGCGHPFLTAAHEANTSTGEFTITSKKPSVMQTISDLCDNHLLIKECSV